MAMEMILMSDVPGLGMAGDLVKVADGYARNFLLPRKLGAPVTSVSKRQVDARRAEREARLRTEREQADHVADRIRMESITVPVKAGPEGKLYGSVQSSDVVDALTSQGIRIDRHMVNLKEPLKELGVFDVPIVLHPDVTVDLKVWIVEE